MNFLIRSVIFIQSYRVRHSCLTGWLRNAFDRFNEWLIDRKFDTWFIQYVVFYFSIDIGTLLLIYCKLSHFHFYPCFFRDQWGRLHTEIVAMDAHVFHIYAHQFEPSMLKRELNKVTSDFESVCFLEIVACGSILTSAFGNCHSRFYKYILNSTPPIASLR